MNYTTMCITVTPICRSRHSILSTLLFLPFSVTTSFKDNHCSNFVTDRLALLVLCAVLCLVTQSCPTLCNSMDCSPPGFSVHGDSPGKKTGVGCNALLQGNEPGIKLRSSRIAGRFFTSEPPGKPHFLITKHNLLSEMAVHDAGPIC